MVDGERQHGRTSNASPRESVWGNTPANADAKLRGSVGVRAVNVRRALGLSMALSAYVQADPYAQAGPYAGGLRSPRGSRLRSQRGARPPDFVPRSPTALVLPAPSYVPPAPLPIGGVQPGRLWPWDYRTGIADSGSSTPAGDGLFRNNPGNSNAPGGSGNVRQQATPLQSFAPAGQPTAPTVTSVKPFSNYHTPSPISPYQYMYGPNRVAGVDNYNLMVRPMLEQQAAGLPWQTRVDNPPMTNPSMTEQWQGPATEPSYESPAVLPRFPAASLETVHVLCSSRSAISRPSTVEKQEPMLTLTA